VGGESGPKIRPKGVVDGKQVNIPVLFYVGSEGRRRLNENGSWRPWKRSRLREPEEKRCLSGGVIPGVGFGRRPLAMSYFLEKLVHP
jgi:hypothetical protein